jgi:hypothetical protein
MTRHKSLPHHGRAMAQAVSRRPPTTETRVSMYASICGIYGGQSNNGAGFQSTLVCLCYYHFNNASCLFISLMEVIYLWQMRESLCNTLSVQHVQQTLLQYFSF